MTEIRHIVFDIGKVLIHWDPEIPFRRLIPDPQDRSWFLTHVCSSEWNLEQDRGRPWVEAENLLIDRFPDHAHNIRAYRVNWHEMVPHHYPQTVAVLERLVAEGRDVTLLTNFAADTFNEASERFNFLKRPRGATVSGKVRLIKPDPAIYHHHVESFGLDPAHTLFIDDSAANIETARAVGWQGIHLDDPQMIEEKLSALGI